MAETLASTLNAPVNPSFLNNGLQRLQGETDLRKRGKTAAELEPLARQEKSRADLEAAQIEAQARRGQLEAEGAQLQQGFERKKSIFQEARQFVGKEPERTITAFNPEKGLELAALTAIIGSFAGSISGNAALSAMEGISNGYRLGQEDLYKREVETYDSELGKFKNRIQQAEEIIKNSMSLEADQRGLGGIELKKLDPLLNDGLILARVKQGDTKGALEDIQKAKDLFDQIRVKEIEAGFKPTASKTASIADETGNLWLVDISQYVPGTALEIGSKGVIGRSATGAQAVAKTTAAASQKEEGARKFNFILNRLDELYKDLRQMNAITDTDKNIAQNLTSFTATLSPVQMGQRAIGGKAQAMRDEIKALQATLLQSIMQATGMSARSLDSNKELEFYLQAATDPTKSFQTNLSAMNTLRSLYGRLEENTYPENEQELIIIQYGAYEPQKYKYEFTNNNQITRTPLPPVKPVSPTQQGAETSQPAAQQQGVDQRARAIGERYQRSEITLQQAAQELRALGGFK